MKNIICIEGVVGAGKTTLGRLLADELSITFFEEPYIGNPFLNKFYDNKKRYSFLSQMYFLNERVNILNNTTALKKCIIDRSIYGDFLFAKMHLKNGYMTKDEFKLYENFWNKLISTRKKPVIIIYLETSVENAMKKIKNRGRDFELLVKKEYWTDLNSEYRDFFDSYNDCNILKINIDDMDIKNNLKDRVMFFRIVKEKMLELGINL